MTNKKINPTEFTSWSEKIWELAQTVLKNVRETPEEKKWTTKVISLFCVGIEAGNTFALEKINAMLSGVFESFPDNY